LNINQKKVISEILVNLLTALISILIFSRIFIERKYDFYSIFIGIIAIISSASLAYLAISIVKK
jgi:hypothetical protein